MNKYALVKTQEVVDATTKNVSTINVVDNIILWDGETTWTPPQNMQLINVEETQCEIGWIYKNGVFAAPINTEQTQ
jgi:hypothetical protein